MSLEKQTFSDYEIIVVDDGSTDGTDARLAVVEGAWRGGALRILKQANRGAASARNRALDAATGDIVVFLDADDWWRDDVLEGLVATLDRHDDIDLVFPHYMRVDVDGRVLERMMAPGGPRFATVDLLARNPLHSATGVAVRRAAAERAGRFDESLRAYIDFDYWLRIAVQRPMNVLRARDVEVAYRRRPGQITCDWRRMRENQQRVWAKHSELVEALPPRVARRAEATRYLYWSTVAVRQGDLGAARRLWLDAAMKAPELAVAARYGVMCGLRSFAGGAMALFRGASR